MRLPDAEPRLFEILCSTLRRRGVVIMPCDTIYGLVGIAPNTEARLRRIKGRGGKSFLRLIPSAGWLSSYTDRLLPEALLAYWPGPLTIIVPAKTGATEERDERHRRDERRHVDERHRRDERHHGDDRTRERGSSPRLQDASGGTVALRVPNDPLLLKVMQALGRPLFSTSVNRSGEPSLWRIDEILKSFERKVNLVVDAGDKPDGVPSTILDVTVTPFRVLRRGAVELPKRLLLQEP